MAVKYSAFKYMCGQCGDEYVVAICELGGRCWALNPCCTKCGNRISWCLEERPLDDVPDDVLEDLHAQHKELKDIDG